jgi:hypothetical protein
MDLATTGMVDDEDEAISALRLKFIAPSHGGDGHAIE